MEELSFQLHFQSFKVALWLTQSTVNVAMEELCQKESK